MGETQRADGDAGFGLVEIVISMLLLAVLALALLPLLIQGLKISATNATMATATQLVDAALDTAGNVTACSSIPTSPDNNVPDQRGNLLTVTKTLGTCPTTFPNTVSYSVVVTRNDTGAVIASATTLLLVRS